LIVVCSGQLHQHHPLSLQHISCAQVGRGAHMRCAHPSAISSFQ
jgi:hypothetical protein